MEENILYEYNNNNYNDNKKSDISSKIKVFNNTIYNLILNTQNISKTLRKQIICSNYLIKEIILEKKYSTKIAQLYDRIGMLEDSRKLLEENIKSINYNIKHFFKEFRKESVFDNKINNINIKEFNNNFEYKTFFNNNYIEQRYNKININDDDFCSVNNLKYKNRSQSNVKCESNYEKYINSQKRIKNNNSSHKQYSMNKSEQENNNKNSYFLNINNKTSRNIKINQNLPSFNLESNFSTITNKNNSIKNNIDINITNKKKNNRNNNHSIILAKNVIRFLNLIKEMKMKYNKKDSIYDSEFKKIKVIYDKLKIYIMNLSKKVIDIYRNNSLLNKKINSKSKDKIQIKENNKTYNNIGLKNNIKINLLIENCTNFSYINPKQKNIIYIISKEISMNIIPKNNPFIKNLSQTKEAEFIIINKDIELKHNNSIINNLKDKMDESKANKEQIELLLNENQELKNQIEEYKESNNISNSKEEMEKYYKETINDNESKIKFLSEQNKYYETEIKKYKENNNKENIEITNLKIENSIIKKEFEEIKKENIFLNGKIKEYKIKNNFEEITPEKYDIICEKNIEKLSWILIREKEEKENNYEKYLWIGKNMVNNLEGFNYLKEEDDINIQINHYITQLEEKDDIIFKLTQKVNKYEKKE